MLPMPMGMDLVFAGDAPAPAHAQQLRRNIEEIVVRWTSQINEVLAEDSSEVFDKEEEQPLPRAGLWI